MAKLQKIEKIYLFAHETKSEIYVANKDTESSLSFNNTLTLNHSTTPSIVVSIKLNFRVLDNLIKLLLRTSS